METYLTYARGMEASESVLTWIELRVKQQMEKEKPTTEEVEHIIDYLVSNEAPKTLSAMTYEQAKSNTDKWVKTLIKKGEHIHETAADTEVVLDFKDGFKIVKLVGKSAFEREGYLMRHCAGSYADRKDTEVYSLRDSHNMPHATIEKDVQIKGKDNGDISPKYIEYVVKFLEYTGMDVRDSEMAHLGYEVVPFGAYTKTKLYRDKYAVKGTKIEYRDDVRIFDSQTNLFNYQGVDVSLFRGDLRITSNMQHGTLAEVSGYVDVREGATFTAPVLAKSGYVDVREGATFTAPVLAEVSGSVYVRKGATFTAPVLAKSGYVDVREGGKLIAPLLGYSE